MALVPKLAIFDMDGTIAIHGEVVPSVMAALPELRAHGCITTISTGRAYTTLRRVLGDAFTKIVSPDAIIIVEHGTKLVDAQGAIIFGEFLTEDEVNHAVDFVRANIELFQLAWFATADPNDKLQVWCADERDMDEQIERRQAYADVFTSSLAELHERLRAEKLTSISFRLKPHVVVENLKLAFTKTNMSVIFQDGNMEFVRSNINKGLAVLEAARKLGISKETILVAGNAINDVEMLDLEVGTAVLVGPAATRQTILSYLSDPTSIVTVDSPDDLGLYLQRLTD